MPSKPTVKQTPNAPDDRSLGLAWKQYRQRHHLPAGRDDDQEQPALVSHRAGLLAGAWLCVLRRERETSGPPWSKLAASLQRPVAASVGLHQLARKEVDIARSWPCLTPDATAPRCQTAQDRKPTKNPHLAGSSDCYGLPWIACWCREGESNPHDVSTGGF